MQTNNIISWVIYFIISVIIAWVTFSLILMWTKPAFYNGDGSINWWVTLWVTILVMVFAWFVTAILAWMFDAMRRYQSMYNCRNPAPPCAPQCPQPLPQPCPPVQPCPPPQPIPCEPVKQC